METIIAEERGPRPVLLNVFLRGGADGLHLVPPVGDDAYYRARPGLAVKRGDALRLTDYFGLHPDLGPLHGIYEAGELAVAHQCGTADETRSHFSAEDYVNHGGLEGGGWIGRFLHRTRDPEDGPLTAVSIGSGVSDALRGVAAVAMRSLEEFTIPDRDPALRGQLGAMYARAGGVLGAAGASTLRALERIELVRKGGGVNGGVAEAGYGDDGFSGGLRLLARLIRARAGLRAATIELGGWDSHFAQAALTSGLMPMLARGLAAFRKDLGGLMGEVHVVVTTEFGRRVAENVSAGTDHGRAGVCFAMGGGVRGGRVLSDWPKGGIGADILEGPGDLPVRLPLHHGLMAVLKRIRPEVSGEAVFPGLEAGEFDW